MNIQAHLPELRRHYKMDHSWMSVDPGRDEGGGEELHYWWDDRDYQHGFHYHNAGSEKLKRGYYIHGNKMDLSNTIAMREDGRRVVGQARLKDGAYHLVDLPLKGKVLGCLQRWGWVGLKSLQKLPGEARAFDVRNSREVAVAIGQDVRRGELGHGLSPWKTYQDTVKDVHYLPDGTLSVLLERSAAGGSNRYRLELTAPDGQEASISFKELHPERYLKAVRLELGQAKFLTTEVTDANAESLLENLEWLRGGNGYFQKHQALREDRVLVMGAEPTLWTCDHATGSGSDARLLEMPEKFDFEKGQVVGDGTLVALSGPKAPVWDGATGKLLTVLPEVTGLEARNGLLGFTDREGTSHRVALEQLPTLKNQGWYQRTLLGQVLGGASDTPPARTGVRLEGQHVNVGGTKVRMRLPLTAR